MSVCDIGFTVSNTTNHLSSTAPYSTPCVCTKARMTLALSASAVLRSIKVFHTGVGISHFELRSVADPSKIILPKVQICSLYDHKQKYHAEAREKADSVPSTTFCAEVVISGLDDAMCDVMLCLYNVWEPVGCLSVLKIELRGIKAEMKTLPTVPVVALYASPHTTTTTKAPVVDAAQKKRVERSPPRPLPPPPPPESAPPKTTVPSDALRPVFSGVVAVLSGFENPLRGQIRAKLIENGGTVASDWTDGRTTHLICAYPNTPKYLAVQSSPSGGEIVRKEWVFDSVSSGRKKDEDGYRLDAHAVKKAKH
eukprot:PhM_4_TR9030/c0_g1_i1/m.48859